jgi:hypothetical protein
MDSEPDQEHEPGTDDATGDAPGRQVPERMAQAWEKALGEPDPLLALGATRALRAHLSAWETTLVEEAVGEGATWGAIGESVGVSRQAAWDRFHHDVHELRREVRDQVHELRRRYRDEAKELHRRYRDEMGLRGRRHRPSEVD